MEKRSRAQELADESLRQNDPVGWFEKLYASAEDASAIPWADLQPNPNLVQWLDQHRITGDGRRALVIGCGLGDDAEELAARGFVVTAFDVSPTAIAWCRRRFPTSRVNYIAADLLDLPEPCVHSFDFVLESYTLQALPPDVRHRAIENVARSLAPSGQLLIVCRGREESDPPGGVPWPLTRSDLSKFVTFGLREEQFEDYADPREPMIRRFRVLFSKADRSPQ